MRFYKEVWGIIWEFNSIGEYIAFLVGRVLGTIIVIGGIYLLVQCGGSSTNGTTDTNYDTKMYDEKWF